MQVKDLSPNKKNPRKISDKKLENLKKSVEKFGDLSGFVFNRRTKTLISGHQRSKTLPKDSKIKIEHKYENPTKAMTVAEGYVEVDGEKFKYREVDADANWETEALLAANKHSGDWDRDVLQLLIVDNPTIDIELAGFSRNELDNMHIKMPEIKVSAPEIIFDDDMDDDEPEEEMTDEEYVASTPETTEQIHTENPNMHVDSRNAFEEAVEVDNSNNTKQIIIIDCGTQEKKDEVKKKLRSDGIDTVYGVRIL